MNDNDASLCQPIYASLVNGLSGDDPAVRLASVYHSFWVMDRLACVGTDYAKSAIQNICKVLILHTYSESSKHNIDIGGLRDVVTESIYDGFGKRLSVYSRESPKHFSGNSIPSQHFYNSPFVSDSNSRPVVKILTARAQLDGLNFMKCCFAGANFSESSFQMTTFDECDLSYSSLRSSNFEDSSIIGDLSMSDVRDCNFSYANVSAIVSGAVFSNTDFTNSVCRFVNPNSALFAGADFRGSILHGSDPSIDITSCIVDSATVFPDGSVLDLEPSRSGDTVATGWGEVVVFP